MPSLKDLEYERRWNSILEHRSISRAAESLGITRGTLAKWYHDHRNEFPATVQDTIRRGSGRYPKMTGPADEVPTDAEEDWRVGRPSPDAVDELKQPREPNSFVDALLNRFVELRMQNERLFVENRRLRNDVARLRGELSALRDKETAGAHRSMVKLLEEVERNVQSAEA